jgi:hypothetical protein
MHRDPGRAVETTTQRENVTMKLESSSVRVEHASEGQGAGRKEGNVHIWAMQRFIFRIFPCLSSETSPVETKVSRLTRPAIVIT